MVASAGNNGKDINGAKRYGTINSPGIEPSVITVGATNTYGTDARSDDTIASYSSKGPTRGWETATNGARVYDNMIKPDLVAPGNKLIGAQSTQNTNAVIPTLCIYYPGLNARQPDYHFDWNTYTYSGLKNGAIVAERNVNVGPSSFRYSGIDAAGQSEPDTESCKSDPDVLRSTIAERQHA